VRIPAEQFLTFRAYGAPPIIVALAAQGAFRGLMDTKTPLYAVGKISRTVVANGINTSHNFFLFTDLSICKKQARNTCPACTCLFVLLTYMLCMQV
jgi:hypothetical protein